jgi:hypothetical protein
VKHERRIVLTYKSSIGGRPERFQEVKEKEEAPDNQGNLEVFRETKREQKAAKKPSGQGECGKGLTEVTTGPRRQEFVSFEINKKNDIITI